MPNGTSGGGGSGGTIVGISNSFTGASTAIELLGDHAYAYSRIRAITDTESSLIEATTGNFYFVGKLSFAYPEFNSDNFRYRMYLNDLQVWGIEVGSGTDANLLDPLDIIVPSYTELKITADNSASSSAVKQAAVLTGRIYR